MAAPAATPIGNHQRKQFAVLSGAAGVRLPLVPDRALDREGFERREHGVVEHCDGVRTVARRARHGRRLSQRGRLMKVPLACQRNRCQRRTVGGLQLHVRSVADESSRAECVECADCDDVSPCFQHGGGNRVVARRVISLGRPDLDAIDPRGVVVIYCAEVQDCPLSSPLSRKFNLLAEPYHAVVVR